MIWSVSTSGRSSTATRPVTCVSAFTTPAPPLAELPHVHEVAADRGGGRHGRAQEMRAPAGALAPFEVAFRRRGAPLAAGEDVGVHAEALRAARLAPLEAGAREDP